MFLDIPAANRLQNADGPWWGSQTFFYDGVGNRSFENATISGLTTLDNCTYPATNNRVQSVVRAGTTTRALTGACSREGAECGAGTPPRPRCSTSTPITLDRFLALRGQSPGQVFGLPVMMTDSNTVRLCQPRFHSLN